LSLVINLVDVSSLLINHQQHQTACVSGRMGLQN